MSHRFMYQNKLSSLITITPRSMAQGVVGGAVPRVANGSGGVIFTGPYTGDGQRIYTIEIDLAGDVGAATFKWRTTDTAPGAWEATGVTTALTDITLSAGVKVRFTTGTGTDFSLGDRWECTAANRFGKRFLYDLDPNERFRTGTPADPESVSFDLLTPQEVKAAILHLHNISSGATTKLQADRVPVQASVQADGVSTSFVSFAGFAGFGSLVGTTSDWAFALTLKTGADVTTRQIFAADHNSGGGGQSISVEVSAGSELTFLIRDTTGAEYGSYSVCTVQPNTIYRVLGSFLYSDKKLRIYKDGVLQITSAALVADMLGGTNFALFRGGDFAAGLGAGAGLNLCDVAVYGEYLDATEALAEFNGTFTPGAARKAWWKMDEGTGTSLADSGPSGYGGVMNGGLAWNAEGTPILSETIAWRAGTMHRYLTSANRTWRYWRLRIEGDSANPDGYIEIGEMYLGGYFEPAEDFEFGSTPDGEVAAERRQETESGSPRAVLLNRLRAAELSYVHLTDADLTSFKSMFQAVKDKDNERSLPLFVHLGVDDAASLALHTLGADFRPQKDGPDDNALSLSVLERAT